MIKRIIKGLLGTAIAAAIVFTCPNTVKASTTDALLAQQQLLAQYQQMLLAQSSKAAPITAQIIADGQKAEVVNNAQNLQAYQAALMSAYLNSVSDQYAKALFLQQALAKRQLSAYEQSLLLNAVQAMQKEQYKALIQNAGLEYSDYLLNAFTYDQNSAKLPFKSYFGLQ